MSIDQKTEASVRNIRQALGLDALEMGDPALRKQYKNPLASQNAKADVLLNSMAVFSEKGVADTTVQDLLNAAKISRRTFYKYFKNKVDVLENIYRLSADMLISRFKSQMSKSVNMGDLVTRIIDVFFDYHADLGPIIRMMQEEAMQSESPLAEHRLATQRKMVDIMDVQLMRFQGVKFDPWVHYAMMWAMESASMHLLKNTPCGIEDVQRCKAVMRGVVGSVLVKLESERPPVPTAPVSGHDPFAFVEKH